MNNDRPLKKLPPRDAEAQELYERQLAACGAETMQETGNLVDGLWRIRVCPRCYSQPGNMGAPNLEGCMEHGIPDYDFIRVLVKPAEEFEPEGELVDAAEAGPRLRPSALSGRPS